MACRRCGNQNTHSGLCHLCMSIEMEESHREREAHFRSNLASQQEEKYHREKLAADEERWLFSLTEQERKRWNEKREGRPHRE